MYFSQSRQMTIHPSRPSITSYKFTTDSKTAPLIYNQARPSIYNGYTIPNLTQANKDMVTLALFNGQS